MNTHEIRRTLEETRQQLAKVETERQALLTLIHGLEGLLSLRQGASDDAPQV